MLHQPLQLVSPSLCPHIWLQQVHSELQGRVRLGSDIYCIYSPASQQDVGRYVSCMNKMPDIGDVAPRCLVSCVWTEMCSVVVVTVAAG